MNTKFLRSVGQWVLLFSLVPVPAGLAAVIDSSPLHDKANYFQRDLLDKHWLDGLYVSIVPAAPPGTRLPHTVNEPGNVIHAGVWTGRYLAGVGYQYAVTRDPQARQHGGEILRALRTLHEVTGKPGLKGNPYQMDNWFKPIVTMFQCSCDDPLVAWFSDTTGAVFMTLDGGRLWHDVSAGLRGARVQNLAASSRRTFVLHARTDQGLFLSRDGGLSWRPVPQEETPDFPALDFTQWLRVSDNVLCRISQAGQLEISRDQGQTGVRSMKGWRIPRAAAFFTTPLGLIASGPGGCYQSRDGENWVELKLWRENETGAADFLHAYWMGRYYGFIKSKE